MADPLMIRLVVERRKRLIASIIGHAERDFYDQLSPAQQADFRTKVLRSVDEYTDLVRDLLKVTGEDVMVNDHVITLLEQIHTKVGSD